MGAGDARSQQGQSSELPVASPPLADSQRPQPLKNWHILLGVLSATFLAYARTLSFEFVYDDFSQIVTNPALHSWRYLPEYFTKNVWAEVYPGVAGNYYRPVFLVWCRLNDALFGNQTGMWHLTTVLAHVFATALVYFLVLRLVRDRLTAGIASLIFGLHPAHIEAVGWVSAVTEPLLGVLFLAAFLCYLRWRQDGNLAKVWLGAALFLYALGLLEKETAAVLPGVLMIHQWLYGGNPGNGSKSGFVRRAGRSLQVALPFWVLTFAYVAARILVLKGFSHVRNPIPLSWMLYTWPALFWFWAKHLVAPVGLGSSYELFTVQHPGLMNFGVPLLAMSVIVVAFFWGARRSREVAFAAAWLILPVLPLLDFAIFPHDDFAHDRYLYLPSVGFALLAALAIRMIGANQRRPAGSRSLQVILAVGLGVALGIGTWTQSFYFENNWVFYRYNYYLAPANPYAANNYGAILSSLGMRQEAIKVLQSANEINPGYWSLTYNLGRNYYLDHQAGLAERYFLKAIQIDPSRADAYYCLGLTELDQGSPQKAEAAFRDALRLKPDGDQYLYHLALALKEQGKTEGALAEFERVPLGSSTYLQSQQEARTIKAGLGIAPREGTSPPVPPKSPGRSNPRAPKR